MDKTVFGRCLPKFAKAEKAFRRNFKDGWEREGASLAVYWRGQLVVDLHGGYADKSALIPWTEDTRTVLFSASKAVAALAMHMLVERNCISRSDALAKHWPEFGQCGKADITLEDVLLHRAGLAAFDEPISLEDALQRPPERIARAIERQRPNWEPGTKSGYHAVTFGWLLDQIVRRVDPQRRSLAQFVRDEITGKHDIDFHLGLPPQLFHTVSRLTMPTRCYKLREVLHDPRVLVVLGILHVRTKGSLRSRIADNPAWIQLKGKTCTLNNPSVLSVEQSAALGVSRARDLGRIFALLLSGEFLSRSTLDEFSRPQIVDGRDHILMVPVTKGHGFLYERHPRKPGKWLLGHPGFGGTTLMMDPEEELVIAYVSNGLKTGMGELSGTYRRVRDAVLDCLAECQ